MMFFEGNSLSMGQSGKPAWMT